MTDCGLTQQPVVMCLFSLFEMGGVTDLNYVGIPPVTKVKSGNSQTRVLLQGMSYGTNANCSD
jgi:hypothetical protein